jgi:hypothetical protein
VNVLVNGIGKVTVFVEVQINVGVRVFVLVLITEGEGGKAVWVTGVEVEEGVWVFVDVRTEEAVKVIDGVAGVKDPALVIDRLGVSVLAKIKVGVRVPVSVRTVV